MSFSVWDAPGLAAPLKSVLVFLFAIGGYFAAGGSLLMVLLEHKAHREGNQPLLSFLQDWSRFFLLMTVVICAVIGVGIWLVLGLTEPWAVMVHARVLGWVWGVVWALAVVQVSAALLYYSGWGVTAPGHHLATAWIFVAAAWLTLFALNGILAFMLTPGTWVATGRLADGFFNDTFNAGLLIHTALALLLGGLFTMVGATETEPPRVRHTLIRGAAGFALVGSGLLPAGTGWQAAILPPAAREALLAPGSLSLVLFYGALALAIVMFLFIAAGPLNRPEGCTRSLALLLLILGFGVTFASEWNGEAARLPHLIPGFLEVNGLDPRDLPRYRAEGFLPGAAYARVRRVGRDPLPAGRELFRLQCQGCHAVRGYNSVVRLIQGWDVATIDHQLGRLEALRGSMPAFAGSSEERHALAEWLAASGKESRK